MINPSELLALSEPLLTFGYGQQLEHPKDGLLLYGPYSNPHAGGRIRIGLIATQEGASRYQRWTKKFSNVIHPQKFDDPNHTVFPGFQAIFQTEWPDTPTANLLIDANELHRAICMEDRHQAIHKAVSIYANAITSYIRERSEVSIDLWIAVIPEEVYRLGRPQSKVSAAEREASEFAMNKKTATRLLHTPSLFDEENQSAEIYLYELNFHNQLKARLLQEKVVLQVIRDSTLAPEDFKKSNGMPLRTLQDPATLAWNIATTAFFKAGGQPSWRQ